MYVKMELVDKIREVLQHFGGEDTIQTFRSGCLGHFVDFRGGNIARKALHAFIYREVRVQDPAREGREYWFHVSGTTLHFGPSEFALVSGLRFGPSSFDPNTAHVIPASSIYHRLFEGKKTTITQMYEKFTAKRLANHPPDYVKIANILIVYRMLFCQDPGRTIDDWILMHFISILPRARRDMGPQGDGAYHWYGPVWVFQEWACEVFPEIVRHLGVPGGQMTTPRLLRWSFIAPSIDFSRFFDRQMDVQPMVPSAAELLTPYVQSLDGDSLLGVRYVVPRKVSKKKLLTGVARRVVPGTCKGISDVVNPTPQHEPDEGSGPSEQGPDRSESPPRPTDSKRPRRSHEGSRGEPGPRPGWFDRVIHVVAASEARIMGQMENNFRQMENSIRGMIEGLSDRMGRLEDLVMGRLRRSPTPSKGPTPVPRDPTPPPRDPTPRRGPTPPPRDPTPPPRDPTPPPRDPTPPRGPTAPRISSRMRGGKARGRSSAGRSSSRPSSDAQSSPGPLSTQPSSVGPSSAARLMVFDLLEADEVRRVEVGYTEFRRKGHGMNIQVIHNGGILWQAFVERMEDVNELLDYEMVAHFLLEVKRRLFRRHMSNVVICSPYFFVQLQSAWQQLHPRDLRCEEEYGEDRYLHWDPPDVLLDIIRGKGGVQEVPWTRAAYAIMICNVGNAHWVTVRICFATWRVELYDSLLFQMHLPENRELDQRRDRELLPLLRLLPRVMWSAGFWRGRNRPDTHLLAMTLDKTIQEQFAQFDSISCGVYAMMYVDRLLFGTPGLDVGPYDIQRYRLSVAKRIFSLSYGRLE
ncbi:hypothetical protein C2S53_008379 [Perilla frutescens var. hirtella]|uniref:Ubiquitin-like protease family profile domain-containing protein n=1 Tax=Perilla frutescens var. hirtella TaxID=608512 RepID=A0AAD4PAA2_PERFH|nr:hypothetical protein C2S53_008379 [Perilla frutescens var. hirtella]